MKKIIIIAVGVVLVAVIAIGAFYIVNLNNTVTTLTEKLVQTPSLGPSPDPLPEPTENYQKEIAELESLYKQKEALLEGYKKSSKSIKDMYGENDDFGYLYTRAMMSFEIANKLYNKAYEYASEYDRDYKTVVSAAQCGKYDTYVQDYEQKLIEADGIIQMLKIEFDKSQYEKAKTILASIAGF